MRKEILMLTAVVLIFGSAALHSQQSTTPKSTQQILEDLKTSNAALIEQQKKTMDTLDEMQKTADQIKTFGKRS